VHGGNFIVNRWKFKVWFNDHIVELNTFPAISQLLLYFCESICSDSVVELFVFLSFGTVPTDSQLNRNDSACQMVP
jgi:hypothetical protein